MPYTFKISFPDGQRATLCAQSKTDADDIARALIAKNADFVIETRKWIGGSLRMTPAAYEALERLARVDKTRHGLSLGDVLCKCKLHCVGGGVRLDREPARST